MAWKNEKLKIGQKLSACLDATSQELAVLKKCLKILGQSPNRKHFERETRNTIEGVHNPWLTDELRSLVEECCSNWV